jgi:hypothetical protein
MHTKPPAISWQRYSEEAIENDTVTRAWMLSEGIP